MKANNDLVYLLVRNSDRNLSNITKELEDKLITFKIIDVENNGMKNYLWRDYRTFDLPILLTKDNIVKGEKAIVSFINEVIKPHK